MNNEMTNQRASALLDEAMFTSSQIKQSEREADEMRTVVLVIKEVEDEIHQLVQLQFGDRFAMIFNT